jgi:cullin 3
VDAGNGNATVYKSDFEPAFLKESEEFYDTESALMLETCDAPDYLRKVCLFDTYST